MQFSGLRYLGASPLAEPKGVTVQATPVGMGPGVAVDLLTTEIGEVTAVLSSDEGSTIASHCRGGWQWRR